MGEAATVGDCSCLHWCSTLTRQIGPLHATGVSPCGLQGSNLPCKSAAPVQTAAVPMGNAKANAQADVQSDTQVSAQAMAQAVQHGCPSAGDTEEVRQHTPIMLQRLLELCS